MLILFLLFILLFLGVLIFAFFKITKWTLKDKVRVKWAISIISILVLTFVVKRVFFTKMEFIQSNVYSNLYIVKNPIKDIEERNKAIVNEIKVHLKTKHKQPKELSYSDTKSIYFYEDGGMTFGFLGEAGTTYFIDHEEDLGGFVSEELGMYPAYRLVEFYYKPCEQNTTITCGELDFYYQGEFINTDTLKFQ